MGIEGRLVECKYFEVEVDCFFGKDHLVMLKLYHALNEAK